MCVCVSVHAFVCVFEQFLLLTVQLMPLGNFLLLCKSSLIYIMLYYNDFHGMLVTGKLDSQSWGSQGLWCSLCSTAQKHTTKLPTALRKMWLTTWLSMPR